ncbi:MAG: GAF domain-containing protein [Melioribacteraceae bacterium]|nr:GAF domain-containing protein [Melioribacteraceae bacterium]
MSNKIIKILLVEDNRADKILIVEFLKEIPSFKYIMTAAETLNDSLDKLEKDTFDIVLLDLNLPDSKGIETFDNIYTKYHELPILLIAGLEDEDLAKKLIKSGAQDYLLKIRLNSFVLERAISYAIERGSFLNKVKHLNSVLTTIRNISKLIANLDDKNILVRRSTEFLVEARGYHQAMCILVDYSGKITNYGMTSDDKSLYPFFENEMKKGTLIPCFMKALDKRETVIIEKFEKDCPVEHYVIANKNLGLIVIPLFYHENDYGILAISMDNKYINEPDEHSLITEISGDISFALNNIQLNAERKQAQYSLKMSEEKYRAFVEDDLTGDYLVTPEGQFLYCNASFLKIFGFKNPEEAYNYNAYKLYSNSSRRDEFLKLVKAKKKLEHMESDILRQDGRKIRIVENVVGNFDEKGNLNDIRGYVIDITKQTIAENNIKRNNERLNILLKIYEHETKNEKDLLDFSLSEAMKLTSSKIGYLYFYNEEKKEFILNSWSNEVMKQCKVLDPKTCYELDKTGIWGEAVRQRKTIILNDFQSDHQLKKGYPEGHIELNNFMTIPIFDNDKIIAVVGVGNKEGDYDESDETQLQLLMYSVWRILEKKMMIETLISAKEKAEFSNKLKSEFLAQMSHEIRSPMSVIISFTNLIREVLGMNLTPELSEYFDGIDTASSRLIRTIDLILNTSEIKLGTYEPSISEIEIISEIIDGVRNEYDPLIRKKGLEFHYHSDLPKALINGDKYSLYQIFVNLIHNAFKYTQVGSISIIIKTNSEKGELYISIEDTGIGISEEYMENIFQPFMQEEMGYSRRYEGNGLGLALVKNYCDLNRISINVESKKGVGSKFTVTFSLL